MMMNGLDDFTHYDDEDRRGKAVSRILFLAFVMRYQSFIFLFEEECAINPKLGRKRR